MSDGVYVTRVNIPESKTHHLVSLIKQEPTDDIPISNTSKENPSDSRVSPFISMPQPLPVVTQNPWPPTQPSNHFVCSSRVSPSGRPPFVSLPLAPASLISADPRGSQAATQASATRALSLSPGNDISTLTPVLFPSVVQTHSAWHQQSHPLSSLVSLHSRTNMFNQSLNQFPIPSVSTIPTSVNPIVGNPLRGFSPTTITGPYLGPRYPLRNEASSATSSCSHNRMPTHSSPAIANFPPLVTQKIISLAPQFLTPPMTYAPPNSTTNDPYAFSSTGPPVTVSSTYQVSLPSNTLASSYPHTVSAAPPPFPMCPAPNSVLPATSGVRSVATVLPRIAVIPKVPTTVTFPVPPSNSPGSQLENVAESIGATSLTWGRVVRLPEGDLHFPGIGHQFSNPKSVLNRVMAAVSMDESFSLQLPPSALDFSLPVESLPNNWLSRTSSSCGSRKGFYACVCCQQSFTNEALYSSHMLRPVACIFYRCHLCRGSETAHDFATESKQKNSVASDSTHPLPDISGAQSAHSPYCTVLFGGIVKSSNRCAVYSHFAYAHPNEVSSWKLQPSLLSVSPLPDSTWQFGAPGLVCPNGDTGVEHIVTPVVHPDTSDQPNNSDPCLSNTVDMESSTDMARIPTKADHSVFYRPGMELVELWRDLERAVNDALPYQELNFLNPKIQSVDFGQRASLIDICGTSFAFELQHMSRNGSSSLHRLYSNSDTTGLPALPSVDSPLTQTILHFVESEVWQSHLFLTDWCQAKWENYTTAEGIHNTEDLIVIEDDLDDNTSNIDGCLDNSRPYISKCKLQPPPAPQGHELMGALNSLQLLFCGRHSSAFGSLKKLPVKHSTSTGIVETDAHLPTKPITPAVESSFHQGLLRCLMCPFRTNHPQLLIEHLSGPRASVTTKCALCGQSVCVKQPDLCAVKAHLLLHMGYFLMCPECGFAPPFYLAPDAAELCLRVHLRFVCFHFNLLQVYVCTQCRNRWKAYNSLSHLCQHLLDVHVKRTHVCLWCTRLDTDDRPATLRQLPSSLTGSNTRCPDSDEQTGNLDVNPNGPAHPVNGVGRSKHCFQTPVELLSHFQTAHRHVLLFSGSIQQSSNVSSNHERPEHSVNETLQPSRTESAEPIEDACRNSPRSATESTNAEPLVSLVPAVDFVYGFPCPECDEVFDRRDFFAQHFCTIHCTSYSRVNCYRCFGSCKRLSFDLDEFRQHLATCPSACELYTTTFAPWLPSVRHPARKGFLSGKPPDFLSSFERLNNQGHRLCFCFHCGIGTRRSDFLPRPINPIGESVTVDTTATDTCDDISSVAGSTASICSPDHASIPATSNVSSVQTPKAVTNSKDQTSGASYFSDLRLLHTHESTFHFIENSSPIACPWCSSRLSCQKRQDCQTTMQHLKMHIKSHPYALWHLERKRRWNKCVADLAHCFCGAALLDSPLAILSHSSAHLLSSDPMSLSSIPGVHMPESTRSAAGLDKPSTGNAYFSHHRINGYVSTSHHISTDRLLRPSPGSHVPCPVDIYRHLRFAIFPEVDHYLDRALLVKQPFCCPICSAQSPTRWALCEHAFVEHWGVLCFICCLFVLPTRSKPDIPIDASSALAVAIPTKSEVDSLNVSKRNFTDLPVSADGTESRSSASSVSSVSGSVGTATTVSPDVIAPNFWNHVHQCIVRRSRFLKSCHKTKDQEQRSDTIGTKPLRDVKMTTPTEETLQAILDWRMSRSRAAMLAVEFPIRNPSQPPESLSPVAILSSPESSSRDDQGRSSAHKKLTITDGSDHQGSLEASKRRKRSTDLGCNETDTETEPMGRRGAIDSRDGTESAYASSTGDNPILKSMRINLGSPPSSTRSDYSESKVINDEELVPCVLCGEQLPLDLWEDHSLSHRNPQMPWNGVQLAKPNRIVLTQRQSKVYRCSICDRRFVTRFGCQRHMMGRHKMAKSRIDWDLLVESSYSFSGKSSAKHSGSASRKSVSNTKSTTTVTSSPSSISCSVASEKLLSRAHTVPSQLNMNSKSTGPAEASASEPFWDEQRQAYYCPICRIPFLSPRSAAIHHSAAHSSLT